MEIKNLSYWDQVDQASTLAPNRGNISRRWRCIVDTTKILDNEDVNDDLDQLNLDRGDGGGVEVGMGLENCPTTTEQSGWIRSRRDLLLLTHVLAFGPVRVESMAHTHLVRNNYWESMMGYLIN